MTFGKGLRSVAAGAAGFAAYVILGCPPAAAQAPAAGDAASLTVSVERPESRRTSTVVTATGSVVAEEHVEVAAETGGVRVLEVAVDEGDEVSAGQVLARLDDLDAKAELRRQRAAVSEAEVALDSAVSGRDRARKLRDGRSLSVEAFEEREAAVGTAEARLEQARASQQALEIKLDRMAVRSPVAGYVSLRTAVEGAIQQQGATMFTVVRDSLIELRAEVPQQSLWTISAGDAATVTTPSGKPTDGKVRLVSKRVDDASRLGTVFVSLPMSSGLLPGMFAEAEIVTGEAERMTVPERSVVWKEGKPNVFLVTDGRAAIREVTVGPRADGRIAIVSGIGAEDGVVSLGAGFLNDGDRVAVSSAETVR
jgi:HlyD family secretion protein